MSKIGDLEKYGDSVKTEKEELTVTFEGNAYRVIEKLFSKLDGVQTLEDVVGKSLLILSKAEGKIVQLIDQRTGTSEKLHIWKE